MKHVHRKILDALNEARRLMRQHHERSHSELSERMQQHVKTLESKLLLGLHDAAEAASRLSTVEQYGGEDEADS